MKTPFLVDFLFLFCLFLAIGILCPGDANAGYLDPGSGSTLMQGIVAIVGAIRRFFSRLFGKKDS